MGSGVREGWPSWLPRGVATVSGWTNLDMFLNARLVEREAEFSTEGETMSGAFGIFGVRMLAFRFELIKALPIPRRWRRRQLERLAEREFGDHPEFSEWWRS
jgi:hypothetical protein